MKKLLAQNLDINLRSQQNYFKSSSSGSATATRFTAATASKIQQFDDFGQCLSNFFEIVHTFNFYLKACASRSSQHSTLKLHQC